MLNLIVWGLSNKKVFKKICYKNDCQVFNLGLFFISGPKFSPGEGIRIFGYLKVC